MAVQQQPGSAEAYAVEFQCRNDLVRPPPGTPNRHASLGVLDERVC